MENGKNHEANCMPEIYPVLCEHLSDNVTLHFKDQRGQLRSVTEIAAPQPFSCVNRSPSRSDFRGGEKAIRYSVNITLETVSFRIKEKKSKIY